KLKTEFNRWAEDGRGEEMERHHIPITAPVLGMMDLQPGDHVLDLGCGAGWATRLLAARVPKGAVVGVDISDEMVRRAGQASREFGNISYRVGSAEKIPADENAFDKVLSVESFYYYADQGRALDELFRVMAPGGRFFILINLYSDNPYSLRWAGTLQVPVHALSEKQYIELISWRGFHNVEARRIPDDSPTPEEYSGKWFKNAAELREFKRIGALLLMATKPS
ncbi:MAG TPA: class I SAM-dependent methyltransferase, partial [Terriglobales bacterium]|nr:class I SAM-dependent methyltransferase [Terriglobales bacterium]